MVDPYELVVCGCQDEVSVNVGGLWSGRWDDAHSATLLLSEMCSAGGGIFDAVWGSSWKGKDMG